MTLHTKLVENYTTKTQHHIIMYVYKKTKKLAKKNKPPIFVGKST